MADRQLLERTTLYVKWIIKHWQGALNDILSVNDDLIVYYFNGLDHTHEHNENKIMNDYMNKEMLRLEHGHKAFAFSSDLCELIGLEEEDYYDFYELLKDIINHTVLERQINLELVKNKLGNAIDDATIELSHKKLNKALRSMKQRKKSGKP